MYPVNYLQKIFILREMIYVNFYLFSEDYLCILTYAYMYDKTDQICI